LREVRQLALYEVTSECWQNVSGHVIREEMGLWELFGLTISDIVISRLTVNVGDDEFSSDEDDQRVLSVSDTAIEGTAPLSGSSQCKVS
jgi:hypothetical protein